MRESGSPAATEQAVEQAVEQGERTRRSGPGLDQLEDRPFGDRVAKVGEWGIVISCALFVLAQLKPHLLLRDTTAAGGDMGAHVWFPAFLRDHLLGDLRVAGWSMDFFAGFPAGQFYFPLPALAVVGLDVVLPYNVAFKVVTAVGPVLLPVGAAILLAGLRAPRPTPALAAVGATAFLFFKGSPHEADAQTVAFNQRIMGGTLASTLAGEFSFGIALALALCFLGALAWSLDRRRSLWVPALLGAAVVLSHLIVAIFAVVGALVIWVTHRPVRNAGPAVAIGAVAGLLTAVWSVPLLASLSATTDMRYEPITTYVTYLFPRYLAWALPLVLVAIVLGIVQRRRSTLVLVVLTAAMAIVFRFWEGVSFAPVWNLRMLPFWYLGLFLLAAVGAAEVARGAGWLARGAAATWREATTTAPDDAATDRDGNADRARVLTITGVAVLVALGALVQLHNTRGFLDFWARWNYSGVEETGAGGIGKAHPEYRALLDTMAQLPPGRAVWEPGSDLDRYGTNLALTMLPYWTDGRITSLEGVYYESSSTTPYTFLTIAKLAGAGNASNPVRGLDYGSIAEFDVGVAQLEALGVRYYLAHSDEAKEEAASEPRLELIARVPDLDVAPDGWEDAVRGDAPLVVPAPPVRVTEVTTDERGLGFRVSSPRVPVVINAVHSPHWTAEGAEGPSPVEDPDGSQVMEVVPTQEEVTLTYEAPPHGWEIYEAADVELVSPLTNQPVVVDALEHRASTDCYEARGMFSIRTERLDGWECVAAPWWDDADASAVPLAADGPDDWQRVRDVADAAATPLPPVTVSDVETSHRSISFRVDEVGVPVVVKVSDFPNWRAQGADGPWRLTPNFMVVVPTAEEVALEFATSAAEWLGRLLTLAGLVGLGLLIWWVPGRRPARRPNSADTMTRPHSRPETSS